MQKQHKKIHRTNKVTTQKTILTHGAVTAIVATVILGIIAIIIGILYATNIIGGNGNIIVSKTPSPSLHTQTNHSYTHTTPICPIEKIDWLTYNPVSIIPDFGILPITATIPAGILSAESSYLYSFTQNNLPQIILIKNDGTKYFNDTSFNWNYNQINSFSPSTGIGSHGAVTIDPNTTFSLITGIIYHQTLGQNSVYVSLTTSGLGLISSLRLTKFNLNNGSTDTTFGVNGYLNVETGNDRAITSGALSVCYDNNFIIAANIGNVESILPGLIKYNSQGQIVTSFGNNGKVIIPVPSGLTKNPLNTYYIGKPLVTYNCIYFACPFLQGSDFKLTVTKILTPNGQIDTNYGTNGTGVILNYSIYIYRIAQTPILRIDSNNNLYACTLTPNPNISGFIYGMICKFMANGQVDTSFGNNGSLIILPRNTNDMVIGCNCLIYNNLLMVTINEYFSGETIIYSLNLNGTNLTFLKVIKVDNNQQNTSTPYPTSTDPKLTAALVMEPLSVNSFLNIGYTLFDQNVTINNRPVFAITSLC